MTEPTLTLAGLPKAWASIDWGRHDDRPAEYICAADLEVVLAVLRAQVSEWRDEINTDSPTSLEERMVEFWERQLGMGGGQ